ncbi:MAG TPA: adenylyl cyclase [Streptosporangiaceae bacterium]|nr:adenylyl cyclase [Streptosporangiaceae bacterium]
MVREASPSGSGPRPPAGGSPNKTIRGRAVRRPALAMLAAVALAAGAWLAAVPSAAAAGIMTTQDPSSICPGANVTAFGPDVCVFNDTMSQATIQADLNAIATQQVPIASQFDSQRYAVFFQPGTYGSAADPLVFQVGYYTEVAGLGAMPQDTVIDGAIDVFNNLCTPGTSNCNSDDNFWRSLSNLTLNVDLPSSTPAYVPPVVDAYGAGCANSEESWSVSQAAPIRRAIINGSVVFQDYCAADDYASGGFMADSKVSGDLDFYGNQQYMVRNSDIGGANGCPNGLWNMVYSGVEGAPAPAFTGQCQQNTVVPTSPVTEEEPFLYTDAQGNYHVFVPAVQHDSSGPSWASGTEAGTSIPLSRFFVASPSTPIQTIELALARDLNLILTPGIYDLNQPIAIPYANTVVLGLGFATLVPQRGNAAMDVASGSGVKLSGLIIDAGPVTSPVLLSVGSPGLGFGSGSAGDPDLIQDVFFRIGGAATTHVSATVSLADDASGSIIDDVWAWRADHGNDVGWTANTGNTGVVVTGNDVTAYGLAVEHYQKDEVIWSGQGGTDIFFQNEMPYDPPSQSAWMASPTQDGYPAFLVSPDVTTFQGYGMGSYVSFVQTSATLYAADAFQSPDLPGVQFHNTFCVWIAGSGGDKSLINGTGGPCTSSNPGSVEPVDLTSYP